MGSGAAAGSEALFMAAERGDVNALRLALRPRGLIRRPDVNVRNGDGWTPLHQAAAYGQLEATKVLLERGARVDAANYLGLTPLDYAACYGHEEVALLLSECGARHTLHTAAALGVLWALARLLQQGDDFVRLDYFGYAPLHWAARHGRYEAAQLLLQHGADPGAADVNGEDALHRAEQWGHDRVAKLLRAHCKASDRAMAV